MPAGAQRLLDGAVAQPVDLAQPHPAGAQGLARPDHDAPRGGVEPHHVERMAGGDAEPAPLPDGEMDDAVVAPEHFAREVDDVAGLGGAGLEPLDHLGVTAGRHEADVLAVVLVGDRQAEAAGQFAGLGLAALAERKAQQLELLARGREQEIALVALLFARPVERAAAVGQHARGDVVAGRQHLGAELARGRQQVAELDRLVALHAWHRRLARHVALGEAVDHHFLEAALVVEHVVRDADALGDAARVVDVLAGAAGALAVGGGAVIVKLQGHADDVVALGLEQRGGDRGIDPARHGHHHAGLLRPAFDIEAVAHRGSRPLLGCRGSRPPKADARAAP